MKLYHYSRNKLDSIKSRRVLKLDPPGEIANLVVKDGYPGSYVDSISFFFDSIPLDIMGDIYGKDHKAWGNGSVLVEHVVDVNKLDNLIPYRVVESELDMKHIESIDWKQWDSSEAYIAKWYSDLLAVKKASGEQGIKRSDLIKQIKHFKGSTRKNIINASRDPDFKNYKDKYAANVAHLMLYPVKGIIPVESSKTIVIGSKVSTESLSAKW